jgi:hypothetical protein
VNIRFKNITVVTVVEAHTAFMVIEAIHAESVMDLVVVYTISRNGTVLYAMEVRSAFTALKSISASSVEEAHFVSTTYGNLTVKSVTELHFVLTVLHGLTLIAVIQNMMDIVRDALREYSPMTREAR